MVTGLVTIIVMIIYQPRRQMTSGQDLPSAYKQTNRLDFECQAQPWHKVWGPEKANSQQQESRDWGQTARFKAWLQHFGAVI